MPAVAPVSILRRTGQLLAPRHRPRSGARALATAALLLCGTAAVVSLPRGALAVMGAASSRPYAEAVATTRRAAQAVLARDGAESCLRGKLTNALLGLSSSCESAGERNALCALADRAAASTGWSLSFMDATAHQLLELIDQAPAGPSARVPANP